MFLRQGDVNVRFQRKVRVLLFHREGNVNVRFNSRQGGLLFHCEGDANAHRDDQNQQWLGAL